MHDLAPGVHTFSLGGPLLTAARVAELAQPVRALGESAFIVIDCCAVEEVSAPGLAALLELGESAGATRAVALAGLSRALTLVAVQVGLAERFAIYTTVQAFERARARDADRFSEPERCAL